jgi:hypothetical protein
MRKITRRSRKRVSEKAAVSINDKAHFRKTMQNFGMATVGPLVYCNLQKANYDLGDF